MLHVLASASGAVDVLNVAFDGLGAVGLHRVRWRFPLTPATPPERIATAWTLVEEVAQSPGKTFALLCLDEGTLTVVQCAIAQGKLASDAVAFWWLPPEEGAIPVRWPHDDRGRFAEDLCGWGAAMLELQATFIRAATDGREVPAAPSAALPTTSVPVIVYTSIGGASPTQASGTVDGLPFYFRYRWGGWRLRVAEDANVDPVDVGVDGAPGWEWSREAGHPLDGYMDRKEVEAIVLRCVLMERSTWMHVGTAP